MIQQKMKFVLLVLPIALVSTSGDTGALIHEDIRSAEALYKSGDFRGTLATFRKIFVYDAPARAKFATHVWFRIAQIHMQLGPNDMSLSAFRKLDAVDAEGGSAVLRYKIPDDVPASQLRQLVLDNQVPVRIRSAALRQLDLFLTSVNDGEAALNFYLELVMNEPSEVGDAAMPRIAGWLKSRDEHLAGLLRPLDDLRSRASTAQERRRLNERIPVVEQTLTQFEARPAGFLKAAATRMMR